MALKETPRALIGVLDSDKKITGFELEVFQTYEAEGENDPMAAAFNPRMIRKPVPPEVVTGMISNSDTALLRENKTLHQQVAELQQAIEQANTAAQKSAADAAAQVAEMQDRVDATNREMVAMQALLARVKAILA